MNTERSALVSALNDLLRQHRTGGSINVTAGVAALGPIFIARALKAVSEARTFDEDNDAYGEHDFGSVKLDGETLFWKIDYYDRDVAFASEDPSDPDKCSRVLTVMFANEY